MMLYFHVKATTGLVGLAVRSHKRDSSRPQENDSACYHLAQLRLAIKRL